MVIYVDIDETICHSPNTPDYSISEPLRNNIDKVNALYNEGHIIVYWTARGTKSGINWYEHTQQQLKEWGVKYHELRMGKPGYDLLICDKTKRIEEI